MGDDGSLMSVQKFDSKNAIKVHFDDCHSKDDSWHRAVFEFSGTKMDRLPIVDIAVSDILSGISKVGVEVGPICFSDVP